MTQKQRPSPAGVPSDDRPKSAYQRVLLKITGESFCKAGGFGIDAEELELIATEIAAAHQLGAQLAVVVGGGNIIRGAKLAAKGHIHPATADQMGMLATAINGLALREMLEKLGHPARALSAMSLTGVAERFIRRRAIRHLELGRIVILVAGTGNPFFTTDTAAALRAVEIGAQVLLKATKVDGIYDKDPETHPDAKRYDSLTFKQVIEQRPEVMDLQAFTMCMEHGIPIIVFNMKQPGNIAQVVAGKPHGTTVS